MIQHLHAYILASIRRYMRMILMIRYKYKTPYSDYQSILDEQLFYLYYAILINYFALWHYDYFDLRHTFNKPYINYLILTK